MTAGPGRQGPGSLAEEAGRLLETLAGWARQGTGPGPDRPGSAEGPSGSCTYCPLCRLLAFLREERPDLAARLADSGPAVAQAASAFAETMRAAFASAARPEPGSGPGVPEPSPDAPPAERIDVR